MQPGQGTQLVQGVPEGHFPGVEGDFAVGEVDGIVQANGISRELGQVLNGPGNGSIRADQAQALGCEEVGVFEAFFDLLHEGLRVPMRQPLPEASYFVILSRAEKRPLSYLWLIHIWDPLPTIPIPLLAGDADVTLDLSKALATIYDLLGFDLSIDYSRPPGVPLSPEESRWVEQRLRDAGFQG